jgi:hypothetical protein
MLVFPAVAEDADPSLLVWRGLASVGKELTPEAFLAAINKELGQRLATKEQSYSLLTSISLAHDDFPERLRVLDTEVCFLDGGYPRKYNSRVDLLKAHTLPVPSAPSTYCNVVVKAKAKSPAAAVKKCMRALDLQRAIWCTMCNPQMQIAFGGSAFSPVNVVRLGSKHTVHSADGVAYTEAVWFEPSFVEAPIFRVQESAALQKKSRWVFHRISICPYGENVIASLIRYVRALDNRDFNSAFLELWGALEALTTPNYADYDKTIQRTAFIFKDNAFHRQILEHLRECRNSYIHSGESSSSARTHCYQLQLYFVQMVYFHLGSAPFFQSLEEANLFLDSPVDAAALARRFRLARKAKRFRS